MSSLPSFLAPVGSQERNPARWAGWIGLSVLFAFGGAFVLGSLLAFMDLGAIVQSAGLEPLPEGPGRLIAEAQLMSVVAASLALLAMATLLAARVAFVRPAWTFLAPARPFRLRLVLAGFVLFGALVLVSFGLERLLTGEPMEAPVFDPDYAASSRLIYAGAGALFLLLAAAAEEIVFRGVLLQLTGSFTRNAAVLVIVNGLLFSALHLDPSPGAFAARAVSGAVWAWTVLRLAGLEFALGAHFANNLLLSLLVEPFSEGAEVGRDYPWPYVAGDVAMSLAAAMAVHLALRSTRLRDWMGER